MASLSKQQLAVQLLYGKLSLPALSLAALLTGFTFSITLSSALHALIPALHSLFLVSLPLLWQASLTWVTPPCLFLLLNGIIMLLTATSGSFSSPSSSSSSELPSTFLSKLPEKFDCNDDFAASIGAPASVSAVDIGAPPGIDSDSLCLPASRQLAGPVVPFIGIPLSHHCLHSHDAIVKEIPEQVLSHGDIDYGDDDNKKEMQGALQLAVIDGGRLEIDGSDDPSSASCEELVLKGGSEPSTPKYSSSSPAMKDNMRRSLSIDSSPYVDDVEASPEYNLSEEAFKKRIEDYIFKVNAKLRSETRFI